MASSLLDDVVADFLAYLTTERGLAPLTIQAYAGDIAAFNHYLQNNQVATITQITKKHVSAYLALLARRKAATATISRHLSSIREFCRFLVLDGYRQHDITKGLLRPRHERRLPQILHVREIGELLRIEMPGPLGQRNSAILELLYATGCRASEVANMLCRDLHLDRGYVRINKGKGTKDRLVPIHSKAIEIVKAYLTDARPLLTKDKKCRNLFLGRHATLIRRETIWRIVKNAAKCAGITKLVSPHTLRHSIATHLLMGGMSLLELRDFLGHESITTTQIYTHLDTEHLFASWRQFHPRASKRNWRKFQKGE